jgi:hypothetical protein
MTAKITCIIKDVNRNNHNDWNLDFTFKIESNTSNTKELTLAVWMGALLNNVFDEKFQDLLRRYVDLYWDSVVYSVDPNGLIVKRPGKIQ